VNKKLTRDQAQAIFDRVAAGEPQKVLAEEYGLSPGTISNLVRGKSWPDLNRSSLIGAFVRGSKLKPKDIVVIHQRLANREKLTVIALDYGVTPRTISNIKTGKTWGHIPKPASKPHRRRVWEGL